MKKLQVLTLVAALALGGGSVFAAVSQKAPAIQPETGFELDIQNEKIAKAFEAGEVDLILESAEDFAETLEALTETAEASNDEFQIIVDDPELQKALDAGDVTIIFED